VVLLRNYSGTKNRIDVLSREGKVLRSLELKEFRGHTSGVAVTRAGDFVVADKENGRIVVFDNSGGSVWASDAGALFRPSALAVDREGRIYVADMRKHCVVVFNKEGVVLRTFNGEGTLSQPMGVALDAAGCVYVADWGNDRVVVFNAEGQVLRTLGQGHLHHPKHVAVDANGSVFVPQKNLISVFDVKGEFAGTLWPGGALWQRVDEHLAGDVKSLAVNTSHNVLVLSQCKTTPDSSCNTDSIVAFDQPLRALEELRQKEVVAFFMSRHPRLGARAPSYDVTEEVLSLIWTFAARSPSLQEVVPGRGIMSPRQDRERRSVED